MGVSRRGSMGSVSFTPAQRLSRNWYLPMIAPVCGDPIGAAMSIEAKNAILEHLGRQHQAMVALLADLVNIDSGSYNKRGVDAVGDQLRVWLDAAGISCGTFPHETFGDCIGGTLAPTRWGHPSR